MKRLQSDNTIYAFAPNMEPALTVSAPSTMIFETIDAFGGQIRTLEDRLENLDFSRVNPATGPLSIEGAMPGDTLAIHIEKIELPEQGTIVTGEGMGVLGDEVEGHATKILPIRDGYVHFDDLKLPVSPMIGGEAFPTGSAHRHGGNMDTKEIAEGTTLYLPVFQPGGLLAIGDVHAVMGDGEVCVSGCEVSSRITVAIDLIKGHQMRWPVVEREGGLYIIVSLPTIEAALHEATREAVLFLQDRRGITLAETAMLASLAESATYFGNHLDAGQTDRLLELVNTGSGDLAIAAARAHGALSLPTANAVKLLTQ